MKIKKFIALLLSLTVFIVTCSAASADANANVEISFCVGDDTLIINGQPVTVVAPYVVGEGTTLVPIRVITEAFGAKVDWNGELQLVTVTYKDTKIELALGYDMATVNDELNLPLLAAPELFNDGYTMVPLRFISEVFGAKVGYDNETRRVTVSLKEGEGFEKECVLGAFSFNLPSDFYFIEQANVAMAYNLHNPGTEIMFLFGPTSEMTDLPENTSLMEALEAEAEAAKAANPSVDFVYEVMETGGKKVFYMAETVDASRVAACIAESGENFIYIIGKTENNADIITDTLLKIINSLKYE